MSTIKGLFYNAEFQVNCPLRANVISLKQTAYEWYIHKIKITILFTSPLWVVVIYRPGTTYVNIL